MVPMNVYPPALTNYLKGGQTNLWRMARNEARNFYELRLTLQGPVIPKGNRYDVLGTPKTFRTLIGGRTLQTGAIGGAVALTWKPEHCRAFAREEVQPS